jgi:hypothetical protein
MKRELKLVASIYILCIADVPESSANKMESWYTYWGIGYADISYHSELEQRINNETDTPGITHVPFDLDILGFYWPMNHQTIVGFIVNMFGDRYENVEYHQYDGFLYSASIMYFPNNIGSGFFTRGDFGAAKIRIHCTTCGVTEFTDWGIGGLIGGGYAIPVTDGTRILLNVNYALRRTEGDITKTLGISIGGLF